MLFWIILAALLVVFVGGVWLSGRVSYQWEDTAMR